VAVMCCALAVAAGAQTPAPYKAPRLDGHPNLSGIWQALNTADWDLLTHSARMGPMPALGAVGAVPPGIGVVEGDEIPYKPDALAKKQANGEHWLTEDPEVKCYMPGVPRATYQPYPFQIVQGSSTILIAYEFAAASRIVYMENHLKPPVDSWMGWSNGHWEGDTLVVDVVGFNDQSWFDRAGDYHSDQLHVVERYTPASPDILNYEATIDDPQVFTRPWKISMPLYRHVEKNAQFLEFRCVEFTEELLYGQFKKK
jgi:hypothetical protein